MNNIEKIIEDINYLFKNGEIDDLLFELNEIVRKEGFPSIAKKSELGREGLYKTLKPYAQPYWQTMIIIFDSLGLDLQVTIKQHIPKKTIVRKESLANVYPHIAHEWHPTKNNPFNPNDVHITSRKKVWWQCFKGHEWIDLVITRSRGKKCPICDAELTILNHNKFHNNKELV